MLHFFSLMRTRAARLSEFFLSFFLSHFPFFFFLFISNAWSGLYGFKWPHFHMYLPWKPQSPYFSFIFHYPFVWFCISFDSTEPLYSNKKCYLPLPIIFLPFCSFKLSFFTISVRSINLELYNS